MGAVDFEAFVHQLADVSGQAILPFFRTAIGIEDKSRGTNFDPVTAADRAAEQAMRTLIKGAFPQHGVKGEEYDDDQPDAEFVWMLDPIDGTKSFIAGLPAWGTLIGLSRNGRPVYGMMHQPFVRERFYGDGAVARYRGPAGERALRVRPCGGLGEALMITTSPRLMNEADRARFEAVENEVQLSRYGGDCYAYCMVAAGHVDLVIETNLHDHDIVPLIPVIEGAGGIVTDWEGNPVLGGGRVVVAGDPRVHAAALEVLAKG